MRAFYDFILNTSIDKSLNILAKNIIRTVLSNSLDPGKIFFYIIFSLTRLLMMKISPKSVTVDDIYITKIQGTESRDEIINIYVNLTIYCFWGFSDLKMFVISNEIYCLNCSTPDVQPLLRQSL